MNCTKLKNKIEKAANVWIRTSSWRDGKGSSYLEGYAEAFDNDAPIRMYGKRKSVDRSKSTLEQYYGINTTSYGDGKTPTQAKYQALVLLANKLKVEITDEERNAVSRVNDIDFQTRTS